MTFDEYRDAMPRGLSAEERSLFRQVQDARYHYQATRPQPPARTPVCLEEASDAELIMHLLGRGYAVIKAPKRTKEIKAPL